MSTKYIRFSQTNVAWDSTYYTFDNRSRPELYLSSTVQANVDGKVVKEGVVIITSSSSLQPYANTVKDTSLGLYSSILLALDFHHYSPNAKVNLTSSAAKTVSGASIRLATVSINPKIDLTVDVLNFTLKRFSVNLDLQNNLFVKPLSEKNVSVNLYSDINKNIKVNKVNQADVDLSSSSGLIYSSILIANFEQLVKSSGTLDIDSKRFSLKYGDLLLDSDINKNIDGDLVKDFGFNVNTNLNKTLTLQKISLGKTNIEVISNLYYYPYRIRDWNLSLEGSINNLFINYLILGGMIDFSSFANIYVEGGFKYGGIVFAGGKRLVLINNKMLVLRKSTPTP